MFKIDMSAAEEAKSSAKTDMDPRLQLLIARMRSGVTKTASASTAENEAAVIARVTDADAWLSLSEVRDATVIGKTNGGRSIVTGRIPVSRIEKVRNQPYVESLKAAQAMRPMLAVATAETEAQPAQMPAGSQASGGNGVVVGVIDYDGDFVHKNFRKANGKTRLLSIWDRTAATAPPARSAMASNILRPLSISRSTRPIPTRPSATFRKPQRTARTSWILLRAMAMVAVSPGWRRMRTSFSST